MSNNKGNILWRMLIGALLFFIVVPNYAHAMNADLNPDVLKKKILNAYYILNQARSGASGTFLGNSGVPKKLELVWLTELQRSIKKYRRLTGENERFSFLEKIVTQEMQEGARYTMEKDGSNGSLTTSFKQEWEKEKKQN
ncbi:hypothetical protein E3J79_02605 [Candidatus Dependentiae bacterium]|nr:MAG: hypothetical protein E3J79_02605 [Candidatus Dependentiae bacterium]